jgi:hypothetical protein
MTDVFNGSGSNKNWSNSANWSNNAPPAAGTPVSFTYAGVSTVDASFAIGDLTIMPSDTLDILSGDTLTVETNVNGNTLNFIGGGAVVFDQSLNLSKLNLTGVQVTAGGITGAAISLSSGGTLLVSGGLNNDTITANSGGTLKLLPGGSENNNTENIGNGGVVDLSAVSTTNDTINIGGSNAKLIINDNETFNGGAKINFSGTPGQIELAGGMGITSGVVSSYNGTPALFITEANGTVLKIPESGLTSVNGISYDAATGDYYLNVGCFLPGTMIASPFGEVAVEHLHPGDLVMTASGAVKTVAWVRSDTLDTRALADAELYAPVCIAKDAIAPGKPARDLWLTPDHAILAGGALIPVKLLVNGGSIRQQPVAEYRFFHIELAKHDLLLAEGLEAESYLGVSRWQPGHGAAEGGLLRGMPLSARIREVYAAHGCRVLTVEEAGVAPVWQSLAARSEALGMAVPRPEITGDPSLAVIANGAEIAPFRAQSGEYVYALPQGAERVTIRSRAASPWHARPWVDDRRRLGVSIDGVWLLAPDGVVKMAFDGDAAGSGWHGLEGDEGDRFRWTDGCAELALPPGAAARALALRVRATLPYPVAQP